LAEDRGDFEHARHLYDQSLNIRKTVGDLSGIASSLHHLGQLYHRQGDNELAEATLWESLLIRKKLGDRHNCAGVLESIGELKLTQNQRSAAKTAFLEALERLKALGLSAEIARMTDKLTLLAESKAVPDSDIES